MNIEKGNKSINICLMIICFYRDRGTSRIFVALFDYDPPTMSPNPEACDEELPFREGQLIKVCLRNYFRLYLCHRKSKVSGPLMFDFDRPVTVN